MRAEMMRAAYVDELGPASSIRVSQLPTPKPGRGEVLVAVEASAVNPVDTFVRSGAYRTPVPLPLVLGRDLVGTVVDAPPESGFVAGERVWSNSLGHDGRQGAAAEFAAVPSDRLYRLPTGAEAVNVVATFHPAATAYLGLVEHAQVQPEQRVFVGGAAGNVGRAALAIGKRLGVHLIASARAADRDECLRLGAEEVLDFTASDFDSRLRALESVDVFWDTSGHHDLHLAVDASAPGARVLLSAATGDHAVLPVRAAYTHDIALLGFVISRASVAQLARAAGVVNELLAAGELTPRDVEVLPLAQAALAHQRMESGSVRGRLVLDVALV